MRKLLFVPAVALLAWGCSDSTEPAVATSVSFAPASVTLDAVGARQVIHATVADQRGRPLPTAPLTWSSASPSVTVSGAGGDSAFVTAAANGASAVTATSGTATGTVQVQVTQVAVGADKQSGDGQTAPAATALSVPLRVRVRDRLDGSVSGQVVNFTVQSGGGSVSSASVTTSAEGTASVYWTLGPATGANTVTATFPGTSLAPLTFTAQGLALVNGALSVASGGNQAGMAGTVLPAPGSVIVKDGAGNPVSGITVNFAVTAGGGAIANPTAVTNAAGIASVTGWRLGTSGAINTVTATAVGLTGNATATLRGIECTGGGATGYEITLCITSTMTTAQRAAFQTAANRWATVVRGDVPNVSGAIPENACGDNPSANFVYDDLVIFAAVEPIDGPGAVLGQAGPCFIRNAGGLPLVGVMEFDEADLATLETRGQLGEVILHEMGHVLGIGSLWDYYGLLQSPSIANNPLDTYYTGAGGRAGFDAIGGTTYTGGQKVPVENTGGAGTMNSHWRESVLRNELMTGFLNSGIANPMSVMTVRSLADMGYVVDPAAADNFFLTLTVRAPGTGSPIEMKDDLYRGPRYTISPRGVFARVR